MFDDELVFKKLFNFLSNVFPLIVIATSTEPSTNICFNCVILYANVISEPSIFIFISVVPSIRIERPSPSNTLSVLLRLYFVIYSSPSVFKYQ